jgi:hypothetical protein
MKPVYSLSGSTERFYFYFVSVTEEILLDHFEHEFLLNSIKNSVPISQETHCISIMTTSWLMLFREILTFVLRMMGRK